MKDRLRDVAIQRETCAAIRFEARCADEATFQKGGSKVSFSNWVSGSRFYSQSGLAFEMVPLHACVELEVGSPVFRRDSSCAADIFGFAHEPRPDWTIPSG